MKIARMRLHITEKLTRRTYLAFWPWPNNTSLCIRTGEKRLIRPGKSGYTEYNDHGEPVLDSWYEAPRIIFNDWKLE